MINYILSKMEEIGAEGIDFLDFVSTKEKDYYKLKVIKSYTKE